MPPGDAFSPRFNFAYARGVTMNDFEKEHPLMNEVTRTINQLYTNKKEEETLQALLKHKGASKKPVGVSNANVDQG